MTDAEHVVGWAGWWLPLPEAWRFFKMDGGYRRGFLVLGNEERPRLEMAWVWVTRRRLNIPRYIRRYLLARVPRRQRAAATGAIEEVELPGFDYVVSLAEEGRTRCVGYCCATHRILHWVYHHGSSKQNRRFNSECLPHWRDQPLDSPSRWRFFDVAFTAPAHFRLHYGTLNLGDMEVILIDPTPWGARPRLCVRHIYPANLALARRPLEEWLGELFSKRRGSYRSRDRKDSPPQVFDHPRAAGFRIVAHLQFLLLFPLRPLVFRMPAGAEASIHLIADLNKLVYIQMSGRHSAISKARHLILDSLPQPKNDEETFP